MLIGWTLGVGDGQGGLACCGSWGHKVLDTNERLNWTDVNFIHYAVYYILSTHLYNFSLEVFTFWLSSSNFWRAYIVQTLSHDLKKCTPSGPFFHTSVMSSPILCHPHWFSFCSLSMPNENSATHTHTQFFPSLSKIGSFLLFSSIFQSPFTILYCLKKTDSYFLFISWLIHELWVSYGSAPLDFLHSRIQAQGPNLTRKCQTHGRRTSMLMKSYACCQSFTMELAQSQLCAPVSFGQSISQSQVWS